MDVSFQNYILSMEFAYYGEILQLKKLMGCVILVGGVGEQNI